MGVRWQRFPQAGSEIGGSGPAVLRQAGQGGQLPGWDVPGLRQPAGLDKRLYLPKSWTSDQDRCAAAGVPEDRRNYRSKTELALELLERVLELGHLRASGDDAFGMSPTFREGLAALRTCWTFRAALRSGPSWTSPEYPGFGRPRKPRLRAGQRRTMEQRGDELPDEAWREITVAQGSQGPRTYRFSAQRVRATRRRKPGEELWAVWRRNLDGSEPRYYRSNAPEDTTLETLAYVGGSRIETDETDVGLDEYETRRRVASSHVAGWSVPAEPAAGLGGKRCPGHEAQVVVREIAPGAVRARSIAVVAGGYAAAQRTAFPRETPLHPPRRQDGAATFRCSTRPWTLSCRTLTSTADCSGGRSPDCSRGRSSPCGCCAAGAGLRTGRRLLLPQRAGSLHQ